MLNWLRQRVISPVLVVLALASVVALLLPVDPIPALARMVALLLPVDRIPAQTPGDGSKGGGSEGCEEDSSESAGSASGGASETGTVTLAGGQSTMIAFGRSRDQLHRRLVLAVETATAQPGELEAIAGDFLRGDGATLPDRSLTTDVELVGDQFHLLVCLPSSADDYGGVDGGEYAGTVYIIAPGKATAVPLTVTFAYAAWWRVLGVCILTFLVASIYTYGLRVGLKDTQVLFFPKANTGEPPDPPTKSYLDWVQTWVGVLSLSLAFAATMATYGATYLRSAVWGGSFTEVIALVGAVFTACVTAASATRLASTPPGGTAHATPARVRRRRPRATAPSGGPPPQVPRTPGQPPKE